MSSETPDPVDGAAPGSAPDGASDPTLANPRRAEATDGLAGRTVSVPGYQVVRELSRGGQGAVLEALQQSTGRRVALKIIHYGQFASARDVKRFEREVQILAALHHPAIPAVYDRGQTPDGSHYLAMEFIEGRPLDQFIALHHERDPGPAGNSQLLKLFMEICDAVNVAHLRGIIHRDLKPANILIDNDGRPHVLDFGLARTALSETVNEDGSSQHVTITGQFIGSLPWASPEQAEGIADRIDIRTDVYSLGVILYQMLTNGKFPYEVVGTMHAVLHNILTAAPVPPSMQMLSDTAREATRKRKYRRRHPPAVNPVVEAIVLKALGKRREDRYQSAGELAQDVGNYLSGRPTQAAGAVTVPWHRRPGVWAATVAAVAVLAVSAAALLWKPRAVPVVTPNMPIHRPLPPRTIAADAREATARGEIPPPPPPPRQLVPIVEMVDVRREPVNGFEQQRVGLRIINSADFATELFEPAPSLPPALYHKVATRTWVRIFASDGVLVNELVKLESRDALKDLWFYVPANFAIPPGIVVVLWDRQTGMVYRSAMTATTLPRPPMPVSGTAGSP